MIRIWNFHVWCISIKEKTQCQERTLNNFIIDKASQSKKVEHYNKCVWSKNPQILYTVYRKLSSLHSQNWKIRKRNIWNLSLVKYSVFWKLHKSNGRLRDDFFSVLTWLNFLHALLDRHIMATFVAIKLEKKNLSQHTGVFIQCTCIWSRMHLSPKAICQRFI